MERVQSKSLNKDTLEGKSGVNSQGNSNSNIAIKKLIVETWVRQNCLPLVCTGLFIPFAVDAQGLNWPGHASSAITLKKLKCSKQVYPLDTLAWDNIIGFRSYYVGLQDQSNV